MNIVIILNAPYPKGMATANRIQNFAKGFLQEGHNAKIILPRSKGKAGDQFKNRQVRGCFEGVDYEYTSGQAYRGSVFLLRRWRDILGDTRAAFKLLFSSNKPDVILLESVYLSHVLLFGFVAFLLKCSYVLVKNELPFYNRSKTFYRRFYINNLFKCFDGIIVISETLKVFLKRYVSEKTKFLLVPILVDVKEVQCYNQKGGKPKRNVVYAGVLDNSKDGVLYLLDSFALLSEKVDDVVLNIIGDTPHEENKTKIRQKIRDLGIENQVVLHGYVTRKKLLESFNMASVLVLFKPTNEQAKFNFPSKVAEYLATGNPVVVTNIGEIPKFLKHGETAFLAQPDDVMDFARKMIQVFENPNLATKVGRNGLELSRNVFDYQMQSKRVLCFFESLRGK